MQCFCSKIRSPIVPHSVSVLAEAGFEFRGVTFAAGLYRLSGDTLSSETEASGFSDCVKTVSDEVTARELELAESVEKATRAGDVTRHVPNLTDRVTVS